MASALITITGVSAVAGLRLQTLENLAAVDVGQVKVEQNEVRRFSLGYLERLLAGFGPHQVGARTIAQDVFDQAEIWFAVLDVKDARRAAVLR